MIDIEKETKYITASLKAVTAIFAECRAEYRVLGSVLVVAHTNTVFRHINDVDVLIDKKSFDCVAERLKTHGFNVIKKRRAIFNWVEANKENHLGLTFLLVGDFNESYFSYRFAKIFELRIKNKYLQPTNYQFNGVPFIGIPIASAIAGIRMSFLNPKRKHDKQALKEEMARTKVKLYNNIRVHIFGVPVPFLYDTFSFLYNIYGGLRVIFGKKYEIW